jgi:hypothetical protein
MVFTEGLIGIKRALRHRLALGQHRRLATTEWITIGNGLPRRTARKVAWSVAVATAAYGLELMWENQKWLVHTGCTGSILFLLSGTYLFGMTPLICREIQIK